jgi:hypothetical protein
VIPRANIIQDRVADYVESTQPAVSNEVIDDPLSTWEEKINRRENLIVQYEIEISGYEIEAEKLKTNIKELKKDISIMKLQQQKELNDVRLINDLRGSIVVQDETQFQQVSVCIVSTVTKIFEVMKKKGLDPTKIESHQEILTILESGQ